MDFFKRVKGIRNEMLVVAIAMLILGLILVVFPQSSVVIICRVIGVAACIWGFLRLIAYFKVAMNTVFSSYGLVQGIALLMFGLFFVLKPEYITEMFVTVIALIVVVSGVLKLQYAVDMLTLKNEMWWLNLVGAVVMTALGGVALFFPFEAIGTVLRFAGIVLMFESIWDIVAILKITKFAKDAGKSIFADENKKNELQEEVVYTQRDDD